MKNFLSCIILLSMLLAVSCKEKSFTIDKNDTGSIAIVVSDTANSIVLFAADELKKHLDLVFCGNIPISDLSAKNLSSFGEAKDDVAKYYRHWRNIFNTKVIPEELRLNNGIKTYFLEYGLLYRLTERIDEFYSLADFDLTDSYLKNALEKSLSDQARNYIRRMQIANENSRLTFICFMAGKSGNKEQIISKAKDLLSFRIQNREKVDINWNVLFQAQDNFMHDQIGMRYLGFLPKDIDSSEF